MRKIKVVDTTDTVDIQKNIDMYTFQYAINEIGTSFVQFLELDVRNILEKDRVEIDFDINELLSCFKQQLVEVVNRVVRINKKYNNSSITNFYKNKLFRQNMLNMQSNVAKKYVFDLQRYKKCEPNYVANLIDLVIYLKANHDIITSLIGKLSLNKTDIVYIKTSLTKLKFLVTKLEIEIKSEKQQFLTSKQKQRYNKAIKNLIKGGLVNG